MEEEIRNAIKKKINDYGYRSAKFRLALVKEEPFWKILLGNIILDISEPKENKTFLKEENFVLEDIYLTIEEFQKFFDYLGHVYIGNISREGNVTINKALQFSIGNYDLCFVGNFPSRDLNFYGRHRATEYFGVEKPIYHADYYIHQSVSSKSRPKLDLTGGEIPFRNVSEAINYFWKTHYEESSLDHRCNIYMPIFEASIANFNLNGNKLQLKFDVDSNLANLDDLSVGVIAENKPNDYRQNHKLKEKKLDIDLDFNPNAVNVYLNYKGKRMDEYDFYDYKPITVSNSPRIQGMKELGLMENVEYEKTLLDQELVSKLPQNIQSLLSEAERAFSTGLFRATLVLFRSSIEEGITMLIKQNGKESLLYNNRNMEIGLAQKIKIITESTPSVNQVKKELERVKWFGDKAAHGANFPLGEQDILQIEPELRLILVKFAEELK